MTANPSEINTKTKPVYDIVLFGYDRTNKRYVAVEVDEDGKVACDAS
jgi:hypothetical protein